MNKWHNYFMSVAEETAKLSKDPRTHVGAVIVHDKRIKSCGYNGAPKSFPDELVPSDSENEHLINQKNTYMCHAEMNAIKAAEKKLGTFDLAPYNLKLYVTAEPCIMCLGGIMWSGIKEVYYGVPSKSVEEITGFDEGFKPHWFKEFKKRGIVVYGNIETELGEQELHDYVNNGKKIYKPTR